MEIKQSSQIPPKNQIYQDSSTIISAFGIISEKFRGNLDIIKEDSSIKSFSKIGKGILELLDSIQPSLDSYKTATKKIMDDIFKSMLKEDQRLNQFWIMLLSLANKQRVLIEEKDVTNFCQYNQDVLFKPLKTSVAKKNENLNDLDWGIVKKLKQVQRNIFKADFLDESHDKFLIAEFKRKIEISLEILTWSRKNSKLKVYTIEILKKLHNFASLDDNATNLVESIVKGRLDKSFLNISHSIIFGDDGGVYLLQNSVTEELYTILREEIGENFLKFFLLSNQDAKACKLKLPIQNFGALRLGLSLFQNEFTSPGKIILVKKTENNEQTKTPINLITDLTLQNYFTSLSDLPKYFHTPRVVDISLNLAQDRLSPKHVKGYIILESKPEITIDKTLISDTESRDWVIDLKPFFTDLFTKIQGLMEKNLAYIDLKPENILYDSSSKKSSFYDPAALVIFDQITECKTCDLEGKFSAEYSAPELIHSQEVNLKPAIAYSCGKLLKKIIEANPLIKFKEEVSKVSDLLTKEAPDSRISLGEAILFLQLIGEETDPKIFLSRYIQKVKDRLKDNKSSLGLKEEIDEIREKFLPIEVSSSDPELISAQETYDAQNIIKEFIIVSEKDEESYQELSILLLLGDSSLGKTTLLQSEYLKSIESWNENSLLPILVDFDYGMDVEEHINYLDQELQTNLHEATVDNFSDKKNLLIFIDNFEKGNLNRNESIEEIITKFLSKVKAPKGSILKLIIGCKSEYIRANSDKMKFERALNQSKVLRKFFLVPLNYSKRKELPKLLLNAYFAKFPNETRLKKTHEHIKIISEYSLEQYITNPFHFNQIMKIYEVSEVSELNSFPKVNEIIELTGLILNSRMKNSLKSGFLDPLSTERLESICKNRLEIKNEDEIPSSLVKFLHDICKHLAKVLHISRESCLKSSSQNDAIFKIFDFEKFSNLEFTDKEIFFILNHLPLEIKIKRNIHSNAEQISIRFIHETARYYYLYKALKEEAELNVNSNECSRILGSRYLTHEYQLVKFLGQGILENSESYKLLTSYLIHQIELTKMNKSEMNIISAANSITILVAAKFSFENLNFDNVIIRSANLCSGMLNYVNFTNCDLSGSFLSNIKLLNAKFRNCTLKNLKFCTHIDLTGHTGAINCITYSPDGRFIASCSDDKLCNLYSATCGTFIKTLCTYKERLICLAFSQDSKSIALGSEDKRIRILDVNSGKEILNLEAFQDIVTSINFSPDMKHFAASSGQNDKTCKIWELSGKEIHTLEGHEDIVSNITYSLDGKLLATSSTDSTCKIWDASTGKALLTIDQHKGPINHVAFSPDAQYIATCPVNPRDEECKIWDVSSGKMLYKLQGHSQEVFSISYSPEGRYIATCSGDLTCRLWEASSGLELKVFQGHSDKVKTIAFSPDSKYLVSGSLDKTSKIWEISSEKDMQICQGHTGGLTHATYSPDGKYIATSSGGTDNTCKIWDISMGKELQTLKGHSDIVRCICYSPDGKYLATCSGDSKTKIWEVLSGNEVMTLSGHKSEVTYVAYSPDGKSLATSSYDKTCKIWDITSRKEVIVLQGHSGPVCSVCCSPGGKFLATSSMDKTSKIWEVESGKMILTLQGHLDAVMRVKYSPDGKNIASISGRKDPTCKIWDALTGQVIHTLSGHAKELTGVAYSPDGKYIVTASADKSFKFWSTASGKEIQCVQGHVDSIASVNFSPNGKFLVTVSGHKDPSCKVWAVNITDESKSDEMLRNQEGISRASQDKKLVAVCLQDGTCEIRENSSKKVLKKLQGEFKKVFNICFSPDVKYVGIIFEDKSSRIYEISTGKLIQSFSTNSCDLNEWNHPAQIKLVREISLICTKTNLSLASFEKCTFSKKTKAILTQQGSILASDNKIEDDLESRDSENSRTILSRAAIQNILDEETVNFSKRFRNEYVHVKKVYNND